MKPLTLARLAVRNQSAATRDLMAMVEQHLTDLHELALPTSATIDLSDIRVDLGGGMVVPLAELLEDE